MCGSPRFLISRVCPADERGGITIDGLRVNNNHGWWLIRASNTEESLVVRYEGKSKKDKNKLFLEVKNFLKDEGLTLGKY